MIPTIISQALTRPDIRLGNLDPVRDLTFVQDTVSGFIAAAKCEAAIGQTLNLGVGHGHRVGDIVNLVLDIVGRDLQVMTEQRRVRPAGSEVERLISDNGTMRDLTGWAPCVELREGLSKVVDFIREHIGAYKSELYNV